MMVDATYYMVHRYSSYSCTRKGIRIIANSFLYDNMTGICEGFAFNSVLDSDWFWKNEDWWILMQENSPDPIEFWLPEMVRIYWGSRLYGCPSYMYWILTAFCFLCFFTFHFALSLSVCTGILPSWKTRWIFLVAKKIRDIIDERSHSHFPILSAVISIWKWRV